MVQFQAGTRLDREGTAATGCLAICDGDVRKTEGAAVHVESPVEAVRIDQGGLRTGANQGQVAANIEVAAQGGRFAGPAQRDRVGAGGQDDGVRPRVQIGLHDGVAQRPRQQGIGRGGDGVGVHHPLPLRLRSRADGDRGLHRPATVEFERPVATARGRPGQVGTRCHIGTGQNREISHQLLARAGLRQIAAVKQQIGIARQRLAPCRQLAGALQQGLRIESTAANLQHAVAAVRQHMNSADVVPACQRVADQRKAVHTCVDLDDLQRAAGALLCLQVFQQRPGIRQCRVDEDQLVPTVRPFAGRVAECRRRGHGHLIAGLSGLRCREQQGQRVGRMEDAILHQLEQRASPRRVRTRSLRRQWEKIHGGIEDGGAGVRAPHVSPLRRCRAWQPRWPAAATRSWQAGG